MTPEEIAKLRKPGYLGDRVRFEEVCAKLDKFSGEGKGRLLDVGAGFGFYSEVAVRLGFVYYGVDPVPRANHVLRMSAEHLDFPDAYFDVVICVDVLEHIRDAEAAVREMLRVLRPGGKIIVHVPNRAQTHVLFPHPHQGDHVRDGYNRLELEGLFSAFSGVTVESTFNSVDALAWEVAFAQNNRIFLDANKIIDFDWERFQHFGWLITGEKL